MTKKQFAIINRKSDNFIYNNNIKFIIIIKINQIKSNNHIFKLLLLC